MQWLRISLFINVVFLCFAKAQNTNQVFIVKQDTINIRGIVYDAFGKPAPNVQVISKKFDFKNYNQFPISVTDSSGRFELKRTSFKDTLRLISFGNYIEIVNNGSRYLTIVLPPESVRTSELIQVSAQRKFKKPPIPIFEINSITCFDCGWGGEVFPHFQGGERLFINFVKNLLTYPEKAINNNVEGDIEIGFTVSMDGSLKEFKVLRGIGYECEEQVIKAIKKSPKWIPGIFNGKPVEMLFSITINFKLTDK
ncbi:MAG: TonB family protein [Janthinobacterium lividum]